MGRLFDEHTNVFRALAEVELERPRRDAVAAAVAEVSGDLRRRTRCGARRRCSACIRSGRSWLVLHEHYGLAGDDIVATLDWAATTLLEDVRRRNEAAG